jgi:hypothetical protein
VSARILYVMSGKPWPCDRGDRIRNYHLLQALIPDNDVTLLTLDAEPTEAPPDGLAGCHHVSIGIPLWQQGLAALAHLDMPVTAGRRSGWLIERRVRNATRGLAWDVVVAAQMRSVPASLALNGVPRVLDLTDSLWNLYSQDASTTRTVLRMKSDDAAARRARNYESFSLTQAELVTVSSEKDATVLQALGGHTRVCVVPNGTDVVSSHVDHSSEHGVLFVGDCLYRPNLEGLLWFVREVWPLVREAEPACTLNVVGSVQNRVSSMLGAVPGVRVHGHVPDVGQYLSQAAVVVNPVLTGSGTAFKSLEAMAWGKALVTTPAGARSLGLTPGVDSLVEATGEEFAAAVCRCLRDPELRSAMGTAAWRRVAESFAWSMVTAPWRALVLGVAGGAASTDTL